jgi:hypothetical protein
MSSRSPREVQAKAISLPNGVLPMLDAADPNDRALKSATICVVLCQYRITRGLILTLPSVDRKKAHLCTTNTFISILFPREESSRQRYLDSYLQDNSSDMQYSASNPVRTEFHFSALHRGDYDVLWGAELWFVVCGCVLVR